MERLVENGSHLEDGMLRIEGLSRMGVSSGTLFLKLKLIYVERKSILIHLDILKGPM